MRRDDQVIAYDIVLAGRHIAEYLDGVTRAELEASSLLQSALLYRCVIMGEAANDLSKEFKAKFPNVEWHKIVAVRNRLVHTYFDVDWDIVWEILHKDVPELVELLQKYIPPLDSLPPLPDI